MLDARALRARATEIVADCYIPVVIDDSPIIRETNPMKQRAAASANGQVDANLRTIGVGCALKYVC